MDILAQNPDAFNQKQCSKCKRLLPATSEYFSLNKTSRGGLHTTCKECARARTRAYYQQHKDQVKAYQKQYYVEHRDDITQQHKQYAEDHKEEIREYKKRYQLEHTKELNDRARQYYVGHKEQFSEYGRRKRAENSEEKRERDRNYRLEHLEKVRARDRQYHLEHREELSAKQRLYYAEHREEILAHQKFYTQTERGIIAKRTSAHNRRARKRNAEGTHTTEELYQQLNRQKIKCYYCHVKLGNGRESWHADHVVPLVRGGTNDISNIVIACSTCNLRKNNKLPHEWTEGGRLL